MYGYLCCQCIVIYGFFYYCSLRSGCVVAVVIFGFGCSVNRKSWLTWVSGGKQPFHSKQSKPYNYCLSNKPKFGVQIMFEYD